MAKSNRGTLLPSILGWGIGGIIVIAPFYAPLAVAMASRLQHFDFLRIWKEIALTGIGLAVLYFLATHTKQTVKIMKERLFKLVVVYALLLISIAVYDAVSGRITSPAIIYGLMIHLRLVGFFLVVYLAFKTKQLNQKFAWWKFILIPAAFVVGFGLLQMTVLPHDALKHIGYSQNTIVPYQTVDNNPDFVRVQSTLRGPNPLGAYLIVIIAIITTFILSGTHAKHRKLLIGFALGALIVLFGTYSRSALVGLMAALPVIPVLMVKRPKWLTWKRAIILISLAAITASGGLYMLRNNQTVDTAVFHTSDSSKAPESSNDQRFQALRLSTRDVITHPLGGGVGSAGPASLRNKKDDAKLAENFYLQIGQEIGLLGLILFIAIQAVIGYRLFKLRSTALATALLASLVGLIIVNMLSHAWADDTLAYIWWGLAGIALAHSQNTSVILNKKRKQYETS